MLCPSWGSQNTEGVSYCITFGAGTTTSCASCGRNLTPGSQFCDVCGTPVVNGVTQTIVGPPALEAIPTKSGSACTLPVFGENGENSRVSPQKAPGRASSPNTVMVWTSTAACGSAFGEGSSSGSVEPPHAASSIARRSMTAGDGIKSFFFTE